MQTTYKEGGPPRKGKLDGLRLERIAIGLCERPPRVLAEALAELPLSLAAIDRLENYARMDMDILRVTGGDRFPPRLREVPK